MKWLIITLLMFSSSGEATEPAHVTLQKSLSQAFLKQVVFRSDRRPDSIIFGEKSIGFFETDQFRWKNRQVKIDLVPPTYKNSIVFFTKIGKKHRLLGKKRFESPLPKAYAVLRVQVAGDFSVPFLLISGALPISRFKSVGVRKAKIELPIKNRSRFTFAMIVNKLGEVVWVHVPVRGLKPFHSYIAARSTRPGVYGILLGKKDGYFQKVDWRGRVLAKVDMRQRLDKQSMHHDFVLRGDHLFTISNEIATFGSSAKYLTNMIIKVPFDPGRDITRLYGFNQKFTPKNTTSTEPDEKSHFVDWQSPKADYDFMHANSLIETKFGYLVSFKHLNKIALVSHDMSRIKWTVGSSAKDDFVTDADGRFSHQHTPRLIRKNELLVFDNGYNRSRSRIVALKLSDKRARHIWSFVPKPRLFSEDRGSVSRLSSGNILAMFVDPIVNGKRPSKGRRIDIIIEFDPVRLKEVARMRLFYFAKSPGYRSFPLKTLGPERPLRSEKDDLIHFSRR